MIRRTKPRLTPPFYHPEPDEFNYDALLAIMRECRAAVKCFAIRCGERNPAKLSADHVMVYLDALADHTRIEDARFIVAPLTPSDCSKFKLVKPKPAIDGSQS